MFKKMKLAPKLAVVIGACLAVIFMILIGLTVRMSGTAISNSVTSELLAVSQANGQQIQQIFDSAGTVAKDMQSYLYRAYKIADTDPSQMLMPTTEEAEGMTQSEIYGRTLTSLNYDVELYIRETARNTAADNDDIAGVGVMFEPYAFQDDMKDFAFYVEAGNADADVEPFGTYEDYSSEIYYKDAAASGKATVTEPYDYNGNKLVSYATPIIYDGQLQGVVMADIFISNFNKVNSANENYSSLYATIYDDKQNIIYDTEDSSDIGHNLSEFTPKQSEIEAMRSSMAQGQSFHITTTREDGRKIIRFFTPIAAGSETWWSQVAVDKTDMNKAVTHTAILLVALSLAALVLLLFVTVFVLRAMLKPLEPVVQAAGQIARGNLDVQLDNVQQDEIGILSRTFMGMADNLRIMVQDVDYVLGGMAEGNFDIHTKAEQSYVGAFHNLLVSIRSLNHKLSGALGQINISADQVSAGSDQVASGAQALSQGATEQASAIEELAASANEIAAQVKTNSENAGRASALAEEAGRKMSESNHQMQNMIGAMGEISEKSGQIGKIIKTIEDIAFQTNILALNAAVEAARAGEAGKGFAVVADEVRNLAGKSAEASNSTAALIEGSIRAVENGTRIADETAQTMLEAVGGAQQVTKIINEISHASNDQSVSINQVTQGIDQISSVIQTNSATAEESAAASEELSGQAQLLKSLVGQFKLKNEENKTADMPDELPVIPQWTSGGRESDSNVYFAGKY